LAEIEHAKALLNTKEFIMQFPLAAMKKLQWISFEDSVTSMANALYAFFGITGEDVAVVVVLAALLPVVVVLPVELIETEDDGGEEDKGSVDDDARDSRVRAS
jgi:hypothetical protein